MKKEKSNQAVLIAACVVLSCIFGFQCFGQNLISGKVLDEAPMNP